MNAQTFTYQYPRAALTVDCVVFGLDESELKVLLIERAPGALQRQMGVARRLRPRGRNAG